jgi:protein import protein ZIM17
LVKKGTLSEDGDLEFWEDGSTTTRTKDDGLPATNGQKSLE